MITQKELLEKTSPEFVQFLHRENVEYTFRRQFDKDFWGTGPNGPRYYISDAFDWMDAPQTRGFWGKLSDKWGEIVDNGNMKKDAHYEEMCDLGAEDEEKQAILRASEFDVNSAKHISDEKFKLYYGVSKDYIKSNWRYSLADRCYYNPEHPDFGKYIKAHQGVGEGDANLPFKEDMVNKPPHYELWDGTEAFDIIKQVLTPEELQGYLKGNVLKYRLRAGKKDNTQQDIDKANWYQKKLSK